MKILVNGLVLAIINILSILFGFFIYFLLKTPNQIAIQAPVACFISVIVFLLWKFVTSRFIERIDLDDNTRYLYVLVTSLIFSPLLFIPIHYLIQGYITSFQNIVGIWLFQVPTNILALTVVSKFAKILRYSKIR